MEVLGKVELHDELAPPLDLWLIGASSGFARKMTPNSSRTSLVANRMSYYARPRT
jgi:hypothetical protein